MSLSPETEALFSTARDALSPSATDRDRNLVALIGKVGAGTSVVAGASAVGAEGAGGVTGTGDGGVSSAAKGGGSVPTVSAGWVLKIVAPLVPIAMVIAAAVGMARTPASSEPIAIVDRSPEVGPARTPTVPTPSSVVEDAQRRAEPTPAPAPVAPPAPPDPGSRRSRVPDGASSPASPLHSRTADEPAALPPPSVHSLLADEVVLVERIHAAQRAGDRSQVIALVDEHDRLYPGGALEEECAASRAMVLCATNESSEMARSFAVSFHARYPTSPLWPRVRAACGN